MLFDSGAIKGFRDDLLVDNALQDRGMTAKCARDREQRIGFQLRRLGYSGSASLDKTLLDQLRFVAIAIQRAVNQPIEITASEFALPSHARQ